MSTEGARTKNKERHVWFVLIVLSAKNVRYATTVDHSLLYNRYQATTNGIQL